MDPDLGPVEILLVEDNHDDVTLATRALTQHGLTNPLRTVSTGEAALDILHTAAPRTPGARRVVLLDLRLPGMHGFDVLRAIRDDPELCQTAVVVLTAANAFDDITAAYAAGANAVLFKPIDFGQLVDCAAELGLGWQLVEPPRRDRPTRTAEGSTPGMPAPLADLMLEGERVDGRDPRPSRTTPPSTSSGSRRSTPTWERRA